jgi:hypothetical protein
LEVPVVVGVGEEDNIVIVVDIFHIFELNKVQDLIKIDS